MSKKVIGQIIDGDITGLGKESTTLAFDIGATLDAVFSILVLSREERATFASYLIGETPYHGLNAKLQEKLLQIGGAGYTWDDITRFSLVHEARSAAADWEKPLTKKELGADKRLKSYSLNDGSGNYEPNKRQLRTDERIKHYPEDDAAGDPSLAVFISEHPQAPFIWPENTLETLMSMTLREQLTIVTKYWGGYHTSAKRLSQPPHNLPDHEVKKFRTDWDLFMQRPGYPPPDVSLILKLYKGSEPNTYDFQYPVPSITALILKHPQLTPVEHQQVSALPSKAQLLFLGQFYRTATRSSSLQNRKGQPRVVEFSFYHTWIQLSLSKERLNKLEQYCLGKHYRMDGSRPHPYIAEAITGNPNISLEQEELQSLWTENLRTAMASVTDKIGGGKAIAAILRGIGIEVDKNFANRLDQARNKDAPIWSDDIDHLLVAIQHSNGNKPRRTFRNDGMYYSGQ